MGRTVRIHVNKNRIQGNLKTEREGRDQELEPVCRAADYETTAYGDRIEVHCAGCGRPVIRLLSKWDEGEGKRLSCGATVYLESDTDEVDVQVVQDGEVVEEF